MTFKEQLAADRDIFLSSDEFAEEVTIDGVRLTGQISAYTADKSERLNQQFDGLHGDWLVVYFKADAYTAQRTRLPVQGQWALINGRRFDVVSCAEQGGICKLVCSAYRQPRGGLRA